MSKINDLDGYIARMSNAMEEKMFFMNEMDLDEYDVVVDFGCATGDLLREIANRGTNAYLVGYDSSAAMIERGKANSINYGSISFHADFESLIDELKTHAKVAIIFSSVWHEIQKSEHHAIFTQLFPLAGAIVVRDMFFAAPSQEFETLTNPQMKAIADIVPDKMIADFTNKWGSIWQADDALYHLMLKYTYIDNWETELLEDYFSTPWDRIMDVAKKHGMARIVDETYTLPYKKEQVKNHFGIELNYPTHRNLILQGPVSDNEVSIDVVYEAVSIHREKVVVPQYEYDKVVAHWAALWKQSYNEKDSRKLLPSPLDYIEEFKEDFLTDLGFRFEDTEKINRIKDWTITREDE